MTGWFRVSYLLDALLRVLFVVAWGQVFSKLNGLDMWLWGAVAIVYLASRLMMALDMKDRPARREPAAKVEFGAALLDGEDAAALQSLLARAADKRANHGGIQ